MSAVNFSDFNANVECLGVGPSAPAGDSFRTAQLAICIVITCGMLLTTMATLWMRKHRRRLRIRSPLPMLIGSFGGITIILVRSSYDYIGREYFPCAAEVAVFYTFM